MKPAKYVLRKTINLLARTLTDVVCDIHTEGFDTLPIVGPAIIMVNHVNSLELPIIYSRAETMVATGYSKVENWSNPVFRLVFKNWDMIPLDRGEADVTAMRRGLTALDAAKILFITPEGTRSHHGRLQKAKPGVVLIAIRSGAPVWPIACYGGEAFLENIKRLRRTEYHVVVGKPFTVDGGGRGDCGGRKITRSHRQEVADEMMYQLAALMPPAYRGYYSDVERASELYLRFTPPDRSNLSAARAPWTAPDRQPSLP